MPILLQEVRRRPPLRRKRFLGVRPAALACAAVFCGVLAGWLFRPGGGLLPTRTATIIVVPQMPLDGASAGRQGQGQLSRPFANAGRSMTGRTMADTSIAPQPELDRNPVGTIPAPAAPARPFSEVERAAPEKYTGFRIVTPQQ